eukprot:gene23913-4435_t
MWQRQRFSSLCLVFYISFALQIKTALSIVPKPLNQTTASTLYSLDARHFDFSATNKDSPLLQKAFTRYSALLGHNTRAARASSSSSLADQRSLDWLRSSALISAEEYATLSARVTSATEQPGTEQQHANAARKALGSEMIIFGCDVAVSRDDQRKTLDTDESYVLEVAAPRIQIKASTVYGAIYALESLVQLLDAGANSINGTVIYDKPRFAFRATMIDTARHWYPIPAIKQHLDAMSAVKMNVMHWHVVDSQSFPFVSERVPVLSSDGAWDQNHVYTANDVRGIVAYANDRGIRVIPEFDTPGHVAAGWGSLGVLTDCPKESTGGRDTHPLNPTLNKTFEVLTDLWTDVLAAFRP